MIKTTRYGKTTVEKEFSDIAKAIKYIKGYSKGVQFSVECDTMDEAKALEDAGISKTISILVKEQECVTEIPAEQDAVITPEYLVKRDEALAEEELANCASDMYRLAMDFEGTEMALRRELSRIIKSYNLPTAQRHTAYRALDRYAEDYMYTYQERTKALKKLEAVASAIRRDWGGTASELTTHLMEVSQEYDCRVAQVTAVIRKEVSRFEAMQNEAKLADEGYIVSHLKSSSIQITWRDNGRNATKIFPTAWLANTQRVDKFIVAHSGGAYEID